MWGLWTLLVALGSCGGSGGGSGEDIGLVDGPPPPDDVSLVTSNGQVLVDWTPVAEANGYTVYWSLTPGIDTATAEVVAATAPPVVIPNLPGGETLNLVVVSLDGATAGAPSSEDAIAIAAGGAEKYFPPWWDVPATNVIPLPYDAGKTPAENGAILKGVAQSLGAGDRLELGGGTWSVESLFNLSLVGTPSAPIRIVASEGATPVITRSNASQNTLNLGQGAPTRYLSLEGLEITGGDIALRMYDCANVWVDSCHIHDCANNAIAANSEPVDHLYFTRNTVHGTAGTGEGFYIGGNFSSPVAHSCVIAMNHVYDTAGSQGDGIEVKQGSWGNWIAENFVHDTNYPCILAYGTDGNPPNLIERNICIGSGDNVMQVQGEAVVRNNLIVDGGNGFYSGDHQGSVRDLVVVHNTILNAGTAARLNDWDGRPGMVFSNNACYSQSSNAIHFVDGSSGVTVAGNIAFGPVSGVASGYGLGGGLSDFVGGAWSGLAIDATPAPGSPLAAAGDAAHAVLEDLSGAMRVPALDVGAVDAD